MSCRGIFFINFYLLIIIYFLTSLKLMQTAYKMDQKDLADDALIGLDRGGDEDTSSRRNASPSQKPKKPEPVPAPSNLVSLMKTDKSVFEYVESLHENYTYEAEKWKNEVEKRKNEVEKWNNEAEYWKRMKIGNNKTGGTKRKS